jgi:UDP-N-acetylglucosamine 2-epimerase (non-hydrolysing)
LSAVRILSVVGARPNFMKLAPVARALAGRKGIEHLIVHTGQHYDPNMSSDFFGDLGIPVPDHDLGVGSGTHAEQTAAVMQRLEPLLRVTAADMVLVYGDVNSTVAAALVAAKAGTPVAHVEAGLRSGDWTMPEEINRVVTDRLASLLFAPSRDATANLGSEGVAGDRIHFVGNVMIDSLVYALPKARGADAAARSGLRVREYAVVTLHRPANVDDPANLRALMDALGELSRRQQVIFPVHPRTRARLNGLCPDGRRSDLRLVEPMGYVEMLSLVMSAGLVITDSGGLQEETSFLGVPCITVRPNTERPITLTEGTNMLVPAEGEALLDAVAAAHSRRIEGGAAIERWDGRAAERIADVLASP